MCFIQCKTALILLCSLMIWGEGSVLAASSGLDASSGGIPNAANAVHVLNLPTDGVEPIAVRTSFHLLDITEFDDELEAFTFSGVLKLTWTDPRQTFDPEKEGVKEKVYQGSYQFNEMAPAWYPQVELLNVSGFYEKHAVLLRVQPDGTSTLIESFSATAESELHLKQYPFDVQNLELVFVALGFGDHELVLQPEAITSGIDEADIRIPQWDLSGTAFSERRIKLPYAGKTGVASACVVNLEMTRRSVYMLRLVVLPLTLIVVLSWSVFWMERSSLGDRMAVSFVGILTAVAFQGVVSEILPKIAYFTLVHSYLNLSFILMCLTIVINLVVGACDKKGHLKLGDLIDRRCRWIFPLVYASWTLFSFVVLR